MDGPRKARLVRNAMKGIGEEHMVNRSAARLFAIL